MGRKVTDNHKIVEQAGQEMTEDLIKQQNAGEDFILGEDDEQTEEAPQGSTRDRAAADPGEALENSAGSEESIQELDEPEETPKKNVFEGLVVLTGAATYLDSGVRYFKNKPVKVTNRKVYEQLLKTGLFVRI